MSVPAPVYCDITELVSNPVRTGIQRVVRELVRNWYGDRALRLCRFDEKRGLVELPEAVSYYLIEPDEASRSAPTDAVRERLAELIVSHKANEVPRNATIFISEVFFDEARCRHYLWQLQHNADNIWALFFDFIPWLHPDLIGIQRSYPLMWYLRFAQHVKNAAFISETTQRDWAIRILKDERRSGTVLPLGADGLRVPRQTFSTNKRNFLAIGSIDGRKNQLAILQAFKELWGENLAVSLTLVGGVFDSAQSIRAELNESAKYPQFRHVERATDTEVGELMSNARATIYASTAEGYGLPPVESLYAGIPCIVSRRVPSVANLTGGLRFLDEATSDEIASEVRGLLRDSEAEQAWKEALELKLPTWQEFGAAAANWIGNP